MPITIKKKPIDVVAKAADVPTEGPPQASATAPLATDALSNDETAVNDNGKHGGPLDSETGEPLRPSFEGDGERALPGVVDREPPDSERRSRDDLELTEDFVARAFIDRFGEKLRYDHDIARWFGWTGACWMKDETKATFDLARSSCRDFRGGHRAMSSKRAIEGVEIMASRDRRVAMKTSDWDSDPWILGTPGGYVSLKTGEVSEADPSMNVSQLTSVSPAEKGTPTPHFSKFLDEVTQSDPALQRFLRQYLGYCLTGDTQEQVLLFIFGPGGNGKSVLQNVANDIMGDYAKTAAMETFSATRQQRHLTEIAMLRGARLVCLSETEKGQRWSQPKINQMTGGDRITANFMRQDMFTFKPTFKPIVVGKHLASVNAAERRRFLIVPFLHKPASPDKTLSTKLRAEYPAILRWMIEGCLDWQQNGLVSPEVVALATKDYFEEEDLFGRWVSECCVCGPCHKAKAKDLWASYREYAVSNGEHAGSTKAVAEMLGNGGYKKTKSDGIVYLGIALKEAADASIADAPTTDALPSHEKDNL